jgi:hypothetical protein
LLHRLRKEMCFWAEFVLKFLIFWKSIHTIKNVSKHICTQYNNTNINDRNGLYVFRTLVRNKGTFVHRCLNIDRSCFESCQWPTYICRYMFVGLFKIIIMYVDCIVYVSVLKAPVPTTELKVEWSGPILFWTKIYHLITWRDSISQPKTPQAERNDHARKKILLKNSFVAFISPFQRTNNAYLVIIYTTALLCFPKNLTYTLAGFEPGTSCSRGGCDVHWGVPCPPRVAMSTAPRRKGEKIML